MATPNRVFLFALALTAAACSDDSPSNRRQDVSSADSTPLDRGVDDTVALDAVTSEDADFDVVQDAEVAHEAGRDMDARVQSGDVAGDTASDPPSDVTDVVSSDSSAIIDAARDTMPAPGGCLAGVTGTHVARFRWRGSGPNTRAYVEYEANTLPDRARWRAGAYSRGAIGSYTPTFTDTFLGEGGLELRSTNFIDVELSTAGLGSISDVTLSIYGRSFSTGSSGSFSWMTFDGAGATPAGSVANSAPYRWYNASATSAFRPSNAGILLRITPGGPSSSLIVSRVEICFSAR
ncbi:MAG: hypothetical protein Q8Q09_28795 [Deltaproteobacteria bacterium]|nr:hypothetical protein [Deltaproteobacteria bacterium]